MELSSGRILKEIDKWSDIYDFTAFTTNGLKLVTVLKNGVELFEACTETTIHGYKLALEYIERINPKHKLNRNAK